jgi:beta-lactamase superfamily II metal-dependent hydrolase
VIAPEAKILIDTGTNKEGKRLAEWMKKEQMEIDLMIITHYDKDHVGGADYILEKIPVRELIRPDYESYSKQYIQFIDELSEHPECHEIKMEAMQKEERIYGNLTLRMSAAKKEDYGWDEENDFSIVTWMTFGNTRLLFTGDAENARQKELLEEGNMKCDILKVPHHGRIEPISQNFLEACHPKIAYITDSSENPADEELIDILNRMGTKVYCAKNGGIQVITDGSHLTVNSL